MHWEGQQTKFHELASTGLGCDLPLPGHLPNDFWRCMVKGNKLNFPKIGSQHGLGV